MNTYPLCIDIGNSNVVACIRLGGRVVFERHETDTQLGAADYAEWLKQTVAPDCGNIRGAIICSVVPALTQTVSDAISAVFGVVPVLLEDCPNRPIEIKIDNPAELGGDLICGAVGAIINYPLPAIVVDMGTATKFSVVDESGSYLGCAIVPGVKSSFSALTKKAALLGDFDWHPPETPIGKNSAQSLNAGAYYGFSAMIDGMCERYAELFDTAPSVILTGGIAVMISPFCRVPHIHDPNLLVDGLAHIYNLNVRD